MMAHSHVNSIRQSTDDFNRNELLGLPVKIDFKPYQSHAETALGSLAQSSLDLEPTARTNMRCRGFLGDAHRRAQKLKRLAFRLRRAGVARYRIEKIIEAKRHEI